MMGYPKARGDWAKHLEEQDKRHQQLPPVWFAWAVLLCFIALPVGCVVGG